MNKSKINIELTLGLINNIGQTNALTFVKNIMNKFKNDIGHFIEQTELEILKLNESITKKIIAYKYDNAYLELEIITNKQTKSVHVQNFSLR